MTPTFTEQIDKILSLPSNKKKDKSESNSK